MKTLPPHIARLFLAIALMAAALMSTVWFLDHLARSPAESLKDFSRRPIPGPQGAVMPASGRVVISPAIQLPVNAIPPIPCSPAARGTLVLIPNSHLCLCDAANWKL